MSGSARLTYEMEAEVSMTVNSIKTLEVVNSFYEIIDRGVLPFVRSNGKNDNALMRVTL